MQISSVLPEARNLDTKASVATSMVVPSGANGVESAEVSVVRERGRVRDGGCDAEVRCGRGAQPQWSEVRNGRRSVLLLFLHHHLSLSLALTLCAPRGSLEKRPRTSSLSIINL
jgi:hypothetical protein